MALKAVGTKWQILRPHCLAIPRRKLNQNQIQKNDQKASECLTWAVVLVGTFETRKENMHHSIWNGNEKKNNSSIAQFFRLTTQM